MTDIQLRPTVATDLPRLMGLDHSTTSESVWQLELRRDTVGQTKGVGAVRDHHMRSCSDLPKSPVGFSTSTKISTVKENTSFHSLPMKGIWVPNASNRPRISPPSMAPGIEPIPPITAAVKALRPMRKPMKYQIEP